MKMYKIIRITDLNGDDKPSAAHRLGRVMDIDPNTIPIEKNMFMPCVELDKSIITTPVAKWQYTDGGLQIITRNSIYSFEVVEDYDEYTENM